MRGIMIEKKFELVLDGVFRLHGTIQIADDNSYACNPQVEYDSGLNMNSVDFANVISIVKSVVNAYINQLLKEMRKNRQISARDFSYIS